MPEGAGFVVIDAALRSLVCAVFSHDGVSDHISILKYIEQKTYFAGETLLALHLVTLR